MIEEWRGFIQKRANGSEIVNYNDPQLPAYIHRGWILPNVTWEKVPHYHDDIELVYIESGNMEYSIDGHIIELHPGDALFINADQIHYSIATENTPATYLLVVIHPSVFTTSSEFRTKYIEPITGNRDISYLFFHKGSESATRFGNIMSELFNYRTNEFQITRLCLDLWALFLSECEGRIRNNRTDYMDSHAEIFKAMINYIHSCYTSPISLDDIAKAGNISKTFCNTLFHKYTNQTPLENLNRYRTGKVSELLLKTNLSMSEIAERTGFSGASYMSEQFKRFYGSSPRVFKKEKQVLFEEIESSI